MIHIRDYAWNAIRRCNHAGFLAFICHENTDSIEAEWSRLLLTRVDVF